MQPTFEAPVGTSSPRSDAVELTWWRAIKIAWSIAWRGDIAAIIVIFVVVGIARLLGVSKAKVDAVSDPLGLALATPVYIWAVRTALRQKWSDFRIVLVSTAPPWPDTELTWWRAAKIVWSIAWRVGVVSVIFALGALVTIGVLGISAERANAAVIASDPLGYFLAFPIYVWAVRRTFRQIWSEFRIVLMPRTQPGLAWLDQSGSRP